MDSILSPPLIIILGRSIGCDSSALNHITPKTFLLLLLLLSLGIIPSFWLAMKTGRSAVGQLRSRRKKYDVNVNLSKISFQRSP